MDAAAATPLSIRRRMAAALLWCSVLLGVFAPLMVVLTIRHEINELLDDTLRASAQALSGVVQTMAEARIPRGDGAVLPPGGVTVNPTGDYVRGRFAWQLLDAAGGVLLHSPHAPAAPLVDQRTLGFTEADSGWRVLGVAVGDQGQTLYVAQTLEERTEAITEAALNTMLASLGVWAVCVVALSRRMRAELAQVSRLVADVQRHDPLDPGHPLQPVTRVELQPIRDAIADLGARLAVRVRNERAFTAHAAHALRTPLAGMDAQLAVALRECAPEQQPRLQRVRDAASRFARVVSALLTLFRSGAELQRQSVDVPALLARMPVAGLEVDMPLAGTTPRLQVDPDLLAAALANLLDNAVRHGARRVHVGVEQDRIVLRDDGPGLAIDRLAQLQTALDREDYAGFTGLGLILSDLVARAHGGRLRLGHGVPGGLQAELWLPAGAAGRSAA
ncbi:sensor histidine kinase [Sphaerotilus sp.]|uniref:sensor histidine kinase n=1 Tax=Sphaerotilus sp. TaxID=2093942 RepID=UPI002ACE0840|nr:ATP-binding protein [Sphaerotilus sp.]MDZ7858422.1 ATP-binding protein [Sphaerotilus sp.]